MDLSPLAIKGSNAGKSVLIPYLYIPGILCISSWALGSSLLKINEDIVNHELTKRGSSNIH